MNTQRLAWTSLLFLLSHSLFCSFSPEKEAGLSKQEWEQCCHFIDKKAPHYFDHRQFFLHERPGLPCPIEKDEKTGLIFIHLQEKKGSFLGRGSFKIVTKSILYGPSPLVVARCEVKQPGDFEMKALDRMRGAPGVVQSYAHIKRSPKRCALFLQYYKHGTLRRVEKGVLQIPFSNIVLIMSELLDGLKTIHERGYFHGDIKPLNVFLDKREGAIHAVLGDFGFAWKYEQLSSTSYRIQTASGEVRICSAEEADKKRGRDLYKLGKMFYLMLLPDEYRKNPLNPDCSEMVVHNLVGEKKEAALLTFELINKGQSRGITLEEALAKVTTLAKRMGL